MGWSAVALLAAVNVAVQLLLTPWLRRRLTRRWLRDGKVQVSVRLCPAGGQPGRWAVVRALRTDSGLELQGWHVHPASPGSPLVSLAPAGRPHGPRERLRLVRDATEVVAGQTSDGPVEIAGSPVALGWLREHVTAAPLWTTG
jgi:hypothetical protein